MNTLSVGKIVDMIINGKLHVHIANVNYKTLESFN